MIKAARFLIAPFVVASFAGSGSAAAQSGISLADSFQVGSNALCSAQILPARAGSDLFDRRYSLVCRDAVAPVGEIYALRGSMASALAHIHATAGQTCTARPAEAVEGLGNVTAYSCAAQADGVTRSSFLFARGRSLFAAHGVAGYDSALKIALRTLVADKPIDAPVEIAMTEGSDAATFARLQAAQLSADSALAEAYRRNNAGDFAAASEFFTAASAISNGPAGSVEAELNAALQQSNLGNHARADELFRKSEATADADPVLARMQRNYRAMHLLNQGNRAAAFALLTKPLPVVAGGDPEALRALRIDAALAERLNAEGGGSTALARNGDGLLPAERAEVLDGQAAQLRGVIRRLDGDPAGARENLNHAVERLGAVRGGRIGSVAWMRAQVLIELAALAEAQGDSAEAERQLRAAALLVESRYPASPALLSTQAQLAGFLARTGRTEEALQLFRSCVALAQQTPTPSLKRLVAPYLAMLATRADADAANDMFQVGQALVRPGVAQTQAVLARELSGGSDAAAGLFRRSLNLAREIERTRIAVAAYRGEEALTNAESIRAAELAQRLTVIEALQVSTQAELSQFPRYRMATSNAMDLPSLQKELHEGEAYLKLIILDDASYALFLTRESARAYPLGVGSAEIGRLVSAIRDSIVKIENGDPVTYPFDIARAYELYARLLGPVEADLGGVKHLVFEPDGAMLTLPPNLLVTNRDSVDAYSARAAAKNGDPFDFTGVAWLGKRMDVTTAVSASAFRDIRNAPRSHARNAYLGLGNNQPIDVAAPPASTRSAALGGSACQWPVATWARPISPAELLTAQRIIGRTGGGDGAVITGSEFSDTRIRQMEGIHDYRVLHFATHGLVTAPQPNCPAEPALLTSFGPDESDGLLTFAEIFDLKLDADLVILSACDTAGSASVATTRAAGIGSGGGTAMDGLVRAFVGAGGRSVLASHWPVPDDFSATERLVTGLFTAPAGTSTAQALQAAQLVLMADPRTSHPYYWSAFAIVGDGSTPVIAPGTAAANPTDTVIAARD